MIEIKEIHEGIATSLFVKPVQTGWEGRSHQGQITTHHHQQIPNRNRDCLARIKTLGRGV